MYIAHRYRLGPYCIPVEGIKLSFILCKEKDMKRKSKATIGIAAGSLVVFFDLLSIAPLNKQHLRPLAGLLEAA